MLMQRIEYAAVADEEKQLVWIRGQPRGNDRRDAPEYLVEGIGVGREDIAARLVRSQAVSRFDLIEHKSIEASEVPFNEAAINVDRLPQLLGNDRGRCERSVQWARDDNVDEDTSKAFRGRVGLSDPSCIQRDVGVPLVTSCKIPIRLAMSQKIKSAAWNHGAI
jgi:hypothetical protein